MPKHPSVSVIIPTKNRAGDLEVTIQSVLAQTRLPDELIIIDQSAEKSFTKPIPIPLRYIHDPNIPGLTGARNSAMALAGGSIWLFLDDDVVLEAKFIDELLAAYEPGVTGVSGIITNYKRPPLFRLVWDKLFMRGPFKDDRQRVYWKSQTLANSKPIRVRQFGGGLMSFRASAIAGIQFDATNFGKSPGEDIDFCASLPKGSVLLIAPRARLFHKKSPEGRVAIHWLSLHARITAYMRERHWRRGIQNNLCFLWLNVGYGFAAALSCLRRNSLAPWRAWREGSQAGIRQAHRSVLQT